MNYSFKTTVRLPASLSKVFISAILSFSASLIPFLISAEPSRVVNYSKRDVVQQFINEMVTKHHFDKKELLDTFSKIIYHPSIINAISKPAEKTFLWWEYKKLFITTKRINQGVKFWYRNRQILSQVKETYGIPPSIIVAIIGIETSYGLNKGKYRVLDALSTLAFDYPPRSKFFKSELKEFLLLTREQKQSSTALLGSYAGAMGLGQFMPSSYRAYAKDYDDDGFADIWNNSQDAIWSIANYLVKHGWKKGLPSIIKVDNHKLDNKYLDSGLKLKKTLSQRKEQKIIFDKPNDIPWNSKSLLFSLQNKKAVEYWLGVDNFYVISRYNHSRLYVMSVIQLAQKLDQFTNKLFR